MGRFWRLTMIKDYLFRILQPQFWLQTYPTNDDLSALIEQAIDNESPVTIVDKYTVKMAGMEIWITNYPHAYGHIYKPNLRELPSARVRAKLRKYISEARLKEITNG